MKTSKEEPIIIEKESYRTAYWIGFIALFIIALIVSNYNTEVISDNIEDNTKLIDTNEYLNLMAEDKENAFLLASPSCSYCLKLEPILIKVINDYDIDMYYINTNLASSTDFANIEATSIELEGFGTPTIVITKNNEVIAVNIGYVEEERIVTFFTENNIIK